MNGLNPDFVPRAALEAAEARCAELEKERDDALESTAWKLMGALQKSEARLATLKAALERLRDEAHSPIAVDISDYGDEWCDGFLAGQANALDAALQEGEKLPDDPNTRAWLGIEPQFTEEET